MFSKKKIINLTILLFFIFNISILIFAGKERDEKHGIGSLGLEIFSRIENLFSGTSMLVSDTWNLYFNLINAQKENTDLSRQIKEYKAMETSYIELSLENKRLRALLKFSPEIDSRYIAAEVTGRDSSKWFNTIVVNRGAKSGVKAGFPVIVPEGIVGQVIEVSNNCSKVLLITDRMSGVDVLVQKSRGRGILSGTGDKNCVLKYLLRKFLIEPGDHIVSSGLDNIFPKGLRIGTVVEAKKKNAGIFQEVEVKPFVDFEKLEEVLIIFNRK
ncbi:MAG: rod shape-determining protein MreC [Deltaproteobacteria bacterium]|nr:MAG: rod shape-determining protein MreC [Deltaproteobacteria bacterium]